MSKKVAVIMGSDSDWPVVQKAVVRLKSYGIETEAHVMSAHRTPEEASLFARSAAENGQPVWRPIWAVCWRRTQRFP